MQEIYDVNFIKKKKMIWKNIFFKVYIFSNGTNRSPHPRREFQTSSRAIKILEI